MSTTSLSLDDIQALAQSALVANGCDADNAGAVADIVTRAERDGSHSHGLFRIPGYVKALRSGKVNGNARPRLSHRSPAILHVDGDGGFAPLAQATGLSALADAAHQIGVAALSLTNIHHFAALWPETEFLAERDLAGIACTAYMPSVAPAGSTEKLFGTNPISFAWPRPGKAPVCYDMATAAMAMGDVMIAARDGKSVPPGTGLDAEGNPTTDPALIAKGVLLPFGGYKGSAISLMVELLAAGLTGEAFSYEAAIRDNHDGGPPRGGEMVIALSPALLAGPGWEDHVEGFMDRLTALEGVRVPGARRHANRKDTGPRAINAELVETIRALI
ncbi:Ldh family oxidoreductase [Roseovarius faecimaris]|uniref:Ldh family oxidoreductase n=1 Tax=Roseovarius faecimaris TaxID=2494550 RepID=A0A6I6IKU1_9RHOB|nr:Ldh family oxidoreductase [Roseovarius faecimaris]QGX97630.1 Ldh family oxidoreductase [Roseovarius faecimaris]